MKIVTIIGARPQFIKAAAFSRRLGECSNWKEIIIHTGQHFDENMSAVFFREMEIPEPDYHLAVNSVMREEMIERMQKGIEEILHIEKPHLLLVYGDTNSTMAGALAAKKLNIKLAHVEAGLRSYNLRMPEEINRVQTDRISDYLFVPAKNAAENLRKENISGKIFEVGDIMYDAIKFYSTKANEKKRLPKFKDPYVLLTLHRQENTDNRETLSKLLKSINKLAEEIKIVCPLHPRTRKKMAEFDLTLNADVIDPVGYFDMVELVKNAQLVLTDSGGLQKEAFYLQKFCITLREETEWTELVDMGANKICGNEAKKILEAWRYFSGKEFDFSANPYGEGDTAGMILGELKVLF